MAPIVSQACIFRTRLLVESIRRMFNARLSVTRIGNPSGTATTISVTAIIKYFSVRSKTGSHSCHPFSEPKSKYSTTSFTKKIRKARPATVKPIFPIRFASLVSCMFSGVGSRLSSVLCRATFPISVASPTCSTRMVPCPSTTVVPRITRLEA